MVATGDITLDMAIKELERQRDYYEKHYTPEFLQKHQITPYERDFRKSVNKKLLTLLYEAKKDTDNPKSFTDQLKKLP